MSVEVWPGVHVIEACIRVLWIQASFLPMPFAHRGFATDNGRLGPSHFRGAPYLGAETRWDGNGFRWC